MEYPKGIYNDGNERSNAKKYPKEVFLARIKSYPQELLSEMKILILLITHYTDPVIFNH